MTLEPVAIIKILIYASVIYPIWVLPLVFRNYNNFKSCIPNILLTMLAILIIIATLSCR